MKVYAPIRSEDEDVRIDSQVLAVTAANVQPNGSGRQLLKETLDDGPWLPYMLALLTHTKTVYALPLLHFQRSDANLVPCRGEVVCDLLIDLMDMGLFVRLRTSIEMSIRHCYYDKGKTVSKHLMRIYVYGLTVIWIILDTLLGAFWGLGLFSAEYILRDLLYHNSISDFSDQ